MNNNAQYTLQIIDKPGETFSKSKCKCIFCYETHHLQSQFDQHFPTNHLQRRMKDVVENLEKKYGR